MSIYIWIEIKIFSNIFAEFTTVGKEVFNIKDLPSI